MVQAWAARVRYVQRVAGTVFGLSLAALIVFWTVKGTKPAGSAALPILYGAAGAAALIWLLAELWRRQRTPNPEAMWVRGRLDAAKTYARNRRTMGDDWYFRKMNEWDFENFEKLAAMKSSPALAGYKENAKTGEEDGIYLPAGEDWLSDGLSEAELRRHYVAEHERYYAQRRRWLKRTYRRLRRGR